MKKVIIAVAIFLKLALAQADEAMTLEAKALVDSTTIAQQFNYCQPGKVTCRVLFLLKDKVSGQPVKGFYNTFVSAERAVGSTGYFMLNADASTFHAGLDTLLDGKINLDTVFPENSNLQVNFDADGLPTVVNVTVKTLGTTKYSLSNISYAVDKATVIGTEYDTADITYSKPVNNQYPRVQ